MKSKNLMICAAVAFSFLGGTVASADQLRIDSVMRDYRLSRSDAAAVATVSGALHFGDGDVVLWARDSGASVRDLGPAYVISYYTHEPVERVWRERRGRDWYDYGIACGIDWGSFNRLDLSYNDFDQMLWLNLSSTAYGCDQPLWDDLSGQGLSFNDIVLTIVLGDGNRDRCDYYANQYRNFGRDWGRLWTAGSRDPHVWTGYRDASWRNNGPQSFEDRNRQAQSDRSRQIQGQQNRQRQQQVDNNRQEQDRIARERQAQDQRNRQQVDRSRQGQDRQAQNRQQNQDNRDNGRTRQDNGGGRSPDRSRGDDGGGKDRGASGSRGR